MSNPIFWKKYSVKDDSSQRLVTFEGWTHERAECHGHQAIGIFESYVSALASYMGMWEEYCDFHRDFSGAGK